MFQVMPTRYAQLANTLETWSATGMPLLLRGPGGLQPAPASDDPGLYLVVPWLARILGIPLATAINLFFGSLIAVATVAGIAGLCKLTRTLPGRIYGIAVILALAWATYRIGDVYAVSFALPIAFAPWLLYLARERAVSRGSAWVWAMLGTASVAGHYVRSHSATALVLFALILVVTQIKDPPRHRALLLVALMIGALLVALPFGHLIDKRDAYLASVSPGHEPGVTSHPFWHSVYIGLGYTDNPYVSEYRDEVAIEKVAELEPQAAYLSSEYEAALRDEVFRIARSDPGFVAEQLAAKAMAAALMILAFLNVGALALLLARPASPILGAFIGAIAFQTLPALLTVPDHAYMLGLYSFTALLAIVAVDSTLPVLAARYPRIPAWMNPSS